MIITCKASWSKGITYCGLGYTLPSTFRAEFFKFIVTRNNLLKSNVKIVGPSLIYSSNLDL